MRTDHKPLVFALDSSADRTPRQSWHLSYIAEFISDIQHISGVDNVVADTLSRPPSATVNAATSIGVDFAAMARGQSPADVADTSLQVRCLDWNGYSLLCDLSTGTCRPLVPAAFKRQVFDATWVEPSGCKAVNQVDHCEVRLARYPPRREGLVPWMPPLPGSQGRPSHQDSSHYSPSCKTPFWECPY